MRLVGRQSECAALDRVLVDARDGRTSVLVLRGDAGAGKSALLTYLSDRVAGWHVTRAVGVESEMELAYAGLHQLCASMLDGVDRLPEPQRNALTTVFGISDGPVPDRFLVALGTLTLFAEVAEQQPLVCIVDDGQWLDQASAQVFGFVARRLLAERIAIVCAARTGSGDRVLTGLPELRIGGLGDRDARELLLEQVHGTLDVTVCDRIVKESNGNPLALLELPRTWSASGHDGGFALPAAQPVVNQIEASYATRLRCLPAATQMLVLAAAAEPLGDLLLFHRAARVLDIDVAAAHPASEAGLLKLAWRVEFPHPLIRSAAYRSATSEDRCRVHGALAAATDVEHDPDRRAWHRAWATTGPDEAVAAELEHSARRAQARGGMAAAAAFLRRAVALSHDRRPRADRALTAARASLQAGAFDDALGLASVAEAAAVDPFQRVQADLLRGHVAFASGLGGEAPRLLLQAAEKLEAFDSELARETYLNAWAAAFFTGDDALLEISRAARALPAAEDAARPLDLLLDGFARFVVDGPGPALETLQQAAGAATAMTVEDVIRWGWAPGAASTLVWDFDGLRAVAVRQVALLREAGALAQLPLHLAQLASAAAWMGDFGEAASLIAESAGVATATGNRIAPYNALRLSSLRGHAEDVGTLAARAIEQAERGGQRTAAAYAHWAGAVLNNGLADFVAAAAAAERAIADTRIGFMSMWVLPELVEASAGTGDRTRASEALAQLTHWTAASRSDTARGIEARARALVTDGDTAEALHREAIDRFSRTQLRPELARAHLLYGEWLHAEGHTSPAREHLRMAYELLATIGMEAFAERAREGLIATGDKPRGRLGVARDPLTPQEEQIARLARDGLSNPQIGAQLFISARTVEWHLAKVFAKLSITSRRELQGALQ